MRNPASPRKVALNAMGCRLRPFIAPLLGIALIFASQSTVAGADLPGTRHDWIELTTTNFRFFSNAGRGETRRVAMDLEELRAVLAELTDYRLSSPVPTVIYVFRHRRSFAPFRILADGAPADVAGYFLRRPLGNYIAVNADRPRVSGIIFHEYVHYVTGNSLGELPVWLSEGLAEFYRTFEIDGDDTTIGLPVISHLAWLRGRLPIPLAELLEVDHDSPLYNESSRRGDLYAQSWALTHYLMVGDEDRRRQLGRYLAMLQQGRDFTAAFTAAFGDDLPALERELRRYLRSPRALPHVRATVDIHLDTSLEVRELARSEVYFRLGDLVANIDGRDSLEYFRAAVAADPANGPALSALAVAAEGRADWRRAGKLHHEALAASPNDPLVLFRWGEYLAARGHDPGAATSVLERSTRLDPAFGPAWAALTRRYLEAGLSGGEVLAAAETAHRLQPTDTAVIRNLLVLYLRDDRRRQAVELVERSLRSHADLQAESWSLIVHNDLRRARELLQDGAADRAERRLEVAEPALPRTGSPIVLGSRMEMTRAAVAHHRAAVLCRDAEQLLDSGSREAARAALDEALSRVGDGPLAASCRRLRDIIDGPAGSPPITVSRASPPPAPTRQDIDRLNALLAEHDLEGAHRLLAELRPAARGASLEWIDDWILEVEAKMRYNRAIEEYNRAVDLYNAGRYAETAEILEALIATLPDYRQADLARALLGDARKAMED